jgi:hypothetical protein
MLKKRWLIPILAIGCMLLSGCNITITSGESKENNETKSEKGSYQIGDLIHKEGNDSYYYGGIVYDSLVINVVKNEIYQSAHTIPMYIEVGVKTPVDLPDSDLSIQIEDINRNTGEASISLKK